MYTSTIDQHTNGTTSAASEPQNCLYFDKQTPDSGTTVGASHDVQDYSNIAMTIQGTPNCSIELPKDSKNFRPSESIEVVAFITNFDKV